MRLQTRFLVVSLRIWIFFSIFVVSNTYEKPIYKQPDLYEKDKNTFPYGMDLIYRLGFTY